MFSWVGSALYTQILHKPLTSAGEELDNLDHLQFMTCSTVILWIILELASGMRFCTVLTIVINTRY